MRMVGSGFELRMTLGSHKVRMIYHFDHLHDPFIRGTACNGHALRLKLITVFIIYLITMAMALADLLFAKELSGTGSFL